MEKSAPLLREVRGKRAEKGIWISFFLLLASGLALGGVLLPRKRKSVR